MKTEIETGIGRRRTEAKHHEQCEKNQNRKEYAILAFPVLFYFVQKVFHQFGFLSGKDNQKDLFESSV